jgi:hypothetical protein
MFTIAHWPAHRNRCLQAPRLRKGRRAGPLATRGPLSKSSVAENEYSASAGLSRLVLGVHDPAFAGTAGSALVQVAISSHPDKCEAGAARRALHFRCEQGETAWESLASIHSFVADL